MSAPVTKPRPEGQPTGPPQPTYQKYLLAKKTPSKLPPQQQPQLSAAPAATQQDWAKTLEANTAGAATNAEDFTKQFMSQMFGGGAPGGGEELHQQSNKVVLSSCPLSILYHLLMCPRLELLYFNNLKYYLY